MELPLIPKQPRRQKMVLINCTTKGCLKQTEAKLNRETDEVICDECGNVVEGLSPMMKRSLGSMGQVLRKKKVKPFQQYCSACKTTRTLHVKGNTALCDECNTQVHVTPAFLQGLKLHLERQAKYEDDGIE